MKSFFGLLVILVVAFTGIFFAYRLVTRSSNLKETGVVTIGFIGPLTGDAMSYGEPIRNAVELAVDEINADGGAGGRMLRVTYEDGECTREGGERAVRKLINEEVQIIIGGVCSSETLALLPISEAAGVLVLSPSATSYQLTGASELFFRNAPSDADGGLFLAALVSEEHETVAVISEDTDYAQALREVFTGTFESFGGRVVANETFIPGTDDFEDILTIVKDANPDAVIVNPQTEIAGGFLVKQIREAGIAVPLYSSNILSGTATSEIAGEYLEGTVIFDSPGLQSDSPSAIAFLESYWDRYGDIGTAESYVGAAYDAVYILADALSATGTDDVEKMRRHLVDMESFGGVIGTYSFDESGDVSGIGHIKKTIMNGEAVAVEL